MSKKDGLPKGIRLRNGSFFVDITVNGVRRTATKETLTVAVAERERLYKVLHGLVLDVEENVSFTPVSEPPITKPLPSGWTLEEATKRTDSVYWYQTAARKKALFTMQQVMEFFGKDTPLEKIDTDGLDEFAFWLETNRKNTSGTVNRKLGVFSRVFQTAIERKKLLAKPHIPFRQTPPGRERFLTHEEEREFLNLLDAKGFKDQAEVFIVLLDTGMRIGELFQLTPENIDISKNIINLLSSQTKTKKPRTLIMTARVKTIIAAKIIQCRTQDRLWPHLVTGWWIRGPWAWVKQQMGFDNDKDFVIHMLRHTCCSRLIQAGVGLIHVQRWMGHSSIKTTQRYAHLAPDDMYLVGAMLDRFNSGNIQAIAPHFKDTQDIITE